MRRKGESNSRNGKTSRKLRTSTGDLDIEVPRDRNGDFQSKVLAKDQASSNEIEAKIPGLYAKRLSPRDIQDTLEDLYGVDISAATISTITDKVWTLVEGWQDRLLAAMYPIIYLGAIHLKLRRERKMSLRPVTSCWRSIWTAKGRCSATGSVKEAKGRTSGSAWSATCKHVGWKTSSSLASTV